MILDFHTHIFPDEVRKDKAAFAARDPWFGQLYADPQARLASAEDVIASMDAAGVDHSIVCGFYWADGGLCAQHNDYLLDAVRRYPDRLSGLAVVAPAMGDRAAQELERCLQAGLCGCGELSPDGQGFDLANEAALAPIAAVLIAHRRPLLTHSSEPVGHQYPGKGTVWPQKLYQAALNFPELIIVGAHWGGGLPFYELMPEVREALRNVYYDTAASTYLYSFDIFPLLARIAGAERILWGSDYPLLGQARFLARTRASGLTADQLDLILGANAARLLRLAVPSIEYQVSSAQDRGKIT